MTSMTKSQMDIHMVDLRGQYLTMKAEIDAAIQAVMASAAFIQGPQVSEFEKKLGSYMGAEFVISCGNGTDALQLVMMTLGFKPGDEIILPVNTYVATAEVIALLGLTPVFVDIDPLTYNIDDRQLARYITSKTKAIVPVHLYGQCANMDSILSIADAHGLFVIEDVAQALGATYHMNDGNKKQAGTMGVMATTSFFPTKSLGCYGDGGAIFTSNPEYAEKVRMIANHGQKTKYHHDLVGVNSRLDTLQAAILSVKLKYLDEEIQKRNDVAAYYNEHLKGVPGLTTPGRNTHSTHVYHQYVIATVRREAFQAHLAKHKIPTMIHYPIPLHRQKAYSGYTSQSFPVTDELSKQIVSLPMHPLMREEELAFICEVIKKFY